MRRKPPEPAGDRQARQVAGITQSLQAKKCWSGKALLPGIAFSTVAPARLAFKPGAQGGSMKAKRKYSKPVISKRGVLAALTAIVVAS
jgi:hypothetical protein